MNIQSKFAYVGFFAYLCSRKAAMGEEAAKPAITSHGSHGLTRK